MTTPAILRALRAQLLVMFVLLLGVALLLASMALPGVRHLFPWERHVPAAISVSIALIVLLGGGALILERVILEPLRYLTDSARDIAAGNLARRMPVLRSRELQDLCAHVDRIAQRTFEDQAHLIRAENLDTLGRLAGSLAHELGSPLGALRGHLHVLRKQLREGDGADAASVCDALDRECERIELILRGLLDYARTRPLASTPVAVNDVIRQAIERLRAQHVLVGIHLTIDIPPEPILVNAERHDLEQVFVNVCANAIEAMKGRGRLAVRLERAARFTLREPARRRDGDPRIEHAPSTRAQRWLARNDTTEIAKIIVADSGAGVSPELIDRIFDPFFTTKPAGKGAGLGLAIVARIVESLQGTVWVTKAREGGAAVHVLLPALPAQAGVPQSMKVRRRPTPPISQPRY